VTVAPTTHLVNVLPPKAGPKAEPVAPNLIASLIHPERKANVTGIQFSPDGARLFTSGYPSGVVQFWDVVSKKEIRRIETPPGYKASADYALLAPDWKTLYVPVEKRSVKPFERDGKKLYRIEYSGQIRIWDVDSGKEKDPLMPTAGSGPRYGQLAPGGRFMVCIEQPSYVSSDTPPLWATVLWELATGEKWKLCDGFGVPSFFPDGKRVAVFDRASNPSTVKVFDLTTRQELANLSYPKKDRSIVQGPVAPDGSVIAMYLYGKIGAPLEVWFLDGKTLEIRGKLVGKGNPDRDGGVGTGRYTQGGKQFVALDGAGNLLLWDVAGQKVIRTLPYGGDRQAWEMAVSPDGKTVAVGWAPKADEELANVLEPDPQDLPQPRVSLIDLDGNAAPKILIAPHGYVGGLAFSPDGKTLAFGGSGAVHLFDLNGQEKKSDPPFAAQFEKLKAAMDRVFDDSEKGYSDAKTGEEKEAFVEKMMETINRQSTPLLEKALELVTPRVKDPAAVEILVWILNTQPASPAAGKAADMLIQHHLEDPKTQDIASRFVRAAMPWTEKMLRALAVADIPVEKKGQALMQLAQCLQTEADFVPQLKKFDALKTNMAELQFGKEHLAKLRARDPAKLEAEAIKLFTEVADKYGDESYGRKKLRDAAKAAIYEILNLAIGKTAPEIASEDIDGKAMKLSDYRGKVVVLDFWGDW